MGYKASNVVKSWYIIFDRINQYIEANNASKYQTLIPINKTKDMLKSIKKYGIK